MLNLAQAARSDKVTIVDGDITHCEQYELDYVGYR